MTVPTAESAAIAANSPIANLSDDNCFSSLLEVILICCDPELPALCSQFCWLRQLIKTTSVRFLLISVKQLLLGLEVQPFRSLLSEGKLEQKWERGRLSKKIWHWRDICQILCRVLDKSHSMQSKLQSPYLELVSLSTLMRLLRKCSSITLSKLITMALLAGKWM